MHRPQERAQSLFTNYWRAGGDMLARPSLSMQIKTSG